MELSNIDCKKYWFEFVIFMVGLIIALAGLYGSATNVTEGITVSDVYFLLVSGFGIVAMLASIMFIQLAKVTCKCQ